MTKGLIIIPAYNEEKNIGKVLDDISALNLNIDIIVVNDGSRDGTEAVVKSKGVKIISLPYNLGYGSALQTGFKYAVKMNYRYVIQFDGDGQHDAFHLKDMIDQLERETADIIIGSRFIQGGSFKTNGLKKLTIKFLCAIIRITTKRTITDPTSGFKGCLRNVFAYYSLIHNFPDDYPDADILIKMLKMKFSIKEIPIHVKNRQYGTSMHSGLKPIIYLVQILISILIVLLRNEKVEILTQQ